MLLIVGNDLKTLIISVSAKVHKALIVCLLFISGLLCYYSAKSISSIFRWEKLVSHTSIHGFEDVREQYTRLYTQLENNPYFMFNYGIELVLAKEYEQSIPILHRVCRYFIDTDILCYLGDAYKGMSQYENAETTYRLASNMVPIKFYPLYCLANLYNETGNVDNAINVANIIINKKEKVRSYTTYKIKTEMKQMVDSLSFISNKSP